MPYLIPLPTPRTMGIIIWFMLPPICEHSAGTLRRGRGHAGCGEGRPLTNIIMSIIGIMIPASGLSGASGRASSGSAGAAAESAKVGAGMLRRFSFQIRQLSGASDGMRRAAALLSIAAAVAGGDAPSSLCNGAGLADALPAYHAAMCGSNNARANTDSKVQDNGLLKEVARGVMSRPEAVTDVKRMRQAEGYGALGRRVCPSADP